MCKTCDAAACSCLEYRQLAAASNDYWKTPAGVLRRIDNLAQEFTYTTVNSATKVVGETNGALWIEWVDKGDSKVCPICKRYARGGRNGFYKITWFMPREQPHHGCRCERKIYFYDPFK